MKHNLSLAALLVAPLFAMGSLLAAPLPPMNAVNITGTVIKATWVPAKKLKAMPGLSGSLGRDRVLPAHLVVTISEFKGPTGRQTRKLNAFVGEPAENPSDESAIPNRMVIWINSEKKLTLAAGTRIHVRGYRVTGDEGGTWAVNEGWEVLTEGTR